MTDDLSGFSMMDLFRMEAEERLAVLSQGLVALEGAGATAEVIEPLMRAAHSLKGAARIVGLNAAVRVAHAMEDCLVAAQKGQIRLEPADIDALLVGVDLLVQVSKISERELESWQSTHGREVERLVADLAAIQAGQAVAAMPAPSATAAAPAVPGPPVTHQAQAQPQPEAQTRPEPSPAIAAQASPPPKAPSHSPGQIGRAHV
jgi:two-component system sensor histidine kinase and response regulator WspE